MKGYILKPTDLFKADQIATDIREYLGGYPYRAMDWQSQNKSLFQWIKLETAHYFYRYFVDNGGSGIQYRFIIVNDGS